MIARLARRASLGCIAAVVVAGCSRTAFFGTDVERCTPGMSATCACANGGAGAQACRSDGVFDACQCADGRADAGVNRCVPGASAGCVCDDARMGAQVCLADGTFGACRCVGTASDATLDPQDAARDDVVADPPDAAVSALCTTDSVAGLPATGTIATGPSQDFVPLCSGVVLLGDRASNEVVALHVTRGVTARIALATAPGDLDVDADVDALYATLAPAPTLARVDLRTLAVRTIALPGAAQGVVAGNRGRVFATISHASPARRALAVVDAAAERVERVVDGEFGPLMAYDRPGYQIIVGDRGGSPSSLRRFAFDPATGAVTLAEELWDGGGNGQSLAISPNGEHLAFPCGGGNGPGYATYDFDSHDLARPRGAWSTGPYPRAAAFSPDGQYVLATNGDDLFLFSVATHALIQRIAVTRSGCGATSLARVGFSRGGRIVYAHANCGFDEDTGQLFWAVLRP